MDKLNELIDFYEMTEADPELLVMLLEFRRHRQDNWEQRAEAEEAQLAELAKQVYPKAVVRHYSGCKYPIIKINSLEVVIAGEREDAEELAEYVNSMRPAPAAVPVDLVPDEISLNAAVEAVSNLSHESIVGSYQDGWSACRDEMLRRIEGLK